MTHTLQIPTAELSPSVRYRVSSAVTACYSWLFFLVVAVVASIVLPLIVPTQVGYLAFLPLAAAALGLFVVSMAALAYVTAGSIRYQLLDDEIRYRAGIFSRTSTSLPYDRIQTVTTANGFVDRMLGLTHVVCQSAADQSNITIPGLSGDAAEQLRETLMNRARSSRQSRPADS